MAIRKLNIPNIIILAVVLLLLTILVFWNNLFPPSKQASTPVSSTTQAQAADTGVKVPKLLAQRYQSIASSLDISRVKGTVNTLTSYPSRIVGYPGCEEAANYVEGQFKTIGLEGVKSETFKVTVPVDEGSKLVINGTEFPIYAMWPNLVRTSQLPPDGLSVHLIDAVSGRLPDFDNKVVQGSAALIDFNSGTEWLNAPRLGARVVLFVEPDDTVRGEAEAKFSAIPVSMPRFWVSKDTAAKIRAMLQDLNNRYTNTPAGERPQLEAKVFCKMPWEKVDARNIVGVIPGTDPKLRKQWIVLHSSYDGTSVVPSLAPGAESSCGIAAMLELARLYKRPEFAPKRSIMFVATSGHFQGLAGMRSFMEKHIDDYALPGTLDNMHAGLNRMFPQGEKRSSLQIVEIAGIGILLLAIAFGISTSIWSKLRGPQRRFKWLVLVPVVLMIASVIGTYMVFSALTKGFDFDVPNPPRFYVWAGLDLTSQTQGVGLFYKGYFYDVREDLQGKFSDLASRSRENAERVAATLGFTDQKDARFADGVNPINGKNWRNFVPGKFALDSEVITLAGGRGISFISTDDSRQLVDTPFDKPGNVNYDNLNKQLVMIACITDHWFRETDKAVDEDYIRANVVDSRTISVKDPLLVGYVQGVYLDRNAKGKSYYKPKTEKDLPDSLVSGQIKLTEALPSNVKTVYILEKPLTKLGVTEPCNFTRMGLQGGLARLSGSVVQYDPRKSFVPNLKVGDCLAVVRSSHKSFMGVRANIVDKTTPDKGEFMIPGVAPVTAGGRGTMTSIGAYKLDPVNGDIVCAPDQGSYGKFYPTEFPITTGFKDMPVIVFNCKATSVYDLIDPQSLRALGGMSVFDGDTNAEPRQFGFAVAVPEPQNPHVEDMAVIFTEDTSRTKSLATGSSAELKRIRLKMIMAAGPGANRLLLLNSTLGNEVIPAKVTSINRKAVPLDASWQVAVDGVYDNKNCKGSNYYQADYSAGTTGATTGVIDVTPDMPRDTKEVFVKTNHQVVPANIFKVIRMTKPWYAAVQGVFDNKECAGKNYLLPLATPEANGSLRSGEVSVAPDLPDKEIFVKTDRAGVIAVGDDAVVLKALVPQDPLRVVIKGVYNNANCTGTNLLAPIKGNDNGDMIKRGGPLLVTALVKSTKKVWIKTNQPEPVAARVSSTVSTNRPMQVFVKGVYTDSKLKGKNFCNFMTVAYNSDSLLRGEIELTSDLPASTKEIYIKPLDKPEGIGYDVTEGGTLDETAYKVARDMWTLDEFRLSRLASKGVINEGLSGLHDQARKCLDMAENDKGSLNYSVFDADCRAAWGFEARAYPDVSATAQDVVNGVIFYLFLMLPFAFFCERLFFAWPDLKWQLLTFFGIFIGIFTVFKYVHPAFQIAGDALIVLIAFIMLALSMLVIFIIASKFEEQLKQFNQSVSGVHKADIGRMSVAAAAFSLGISNMRRRKARTVLTCTTLVLLTFIVLSFTSIVSSLRFNKVPAKRDSDTHIYNGIMIRTAMWESMQELAYRLLKDEFGNEGKRGAKVYPVAPRAWFFGTILGEQSFLTLRNGDKAYDAKGAVGMMPDEAEIMDLETVNKKAFLAGDWFGYKNGKRVPGKVDPHSIIIPTAIADKLGITPDQIGKAQVTFAGSKYTVIAIIKNDVFKKIKDLDNEPLTPVDYILMSKQSQQQSSMGEAGFREYTHHEPDNVFIVPYGTLMSMGGELKSIAIKFASFEEVQNQLDALMPRLGLNLYAGVGDSIYRYSSIGASSSKGFSNVFIPVLLAALIVLNTMLGSVFERVREIGIFSSIGLAPNHIAILFIAESMVYANLGAVAGYVLGQAVSKFLMATHLLPGLYLNFSSMSAVTSTIIVVTVVLLSTLYPARKASEVATPSVDRSWKVPDPVGDNWDIVLPFAITGAQASGVTGFLREWFQAYEEYSIGDFVTQGVKSGEVENEFGKGYEIVCKSWLAPFDLGVSQQVRLQTVPTSMEDVFEVRVRITRDSGDISNWKRVNRRFLNTLRKQFLIWRTLSSEDRAKYIQDALAAETTGVETGAAPSQLS